MSNNTNTNNKFKAFLENTQSTKKPVYYKKKYTYQPKNSSNTANSNKEQKKTSYYKPKYAKKLRKAEFMILGSKEEIQDLVKSQSHFVGEKYDVNGALGCVNINKYKDKPQRNDEIKDVLNHKNEIKNYACGNQCEWLGLNNNDWKGKVQKFTGKNNLNDVYSLGLSFQNGSDTLDGNPFVGGSVDLDDKSMEDGAKRELREEVGLGLKQDYKKEELVDFQGQWNNKHYEQVPIWMINASDIIKLKDAKPIEIR